MAAMTRTDVSFNTLRITDLAACTTAIDAAPNPKAKFKIFDELTDQGLDSVSLDILNYIDDPNNSADPFQTRFHDNGIEVTLAGRALKTIANSMVLSEHLMNSIGDSGKRELYFVCHNVDSYIHSKIFYKLVKIHSSPNCNRICFNRSHPLHGLCHEMWELRHFPHVECPCNGQTTVMTITHDAGLADILTIQLTIKVKPKLD